MKQYTKEFTEKYGESMKFGKELLELIKHIVLTVHFCDSPEEIKTTISQTFKAVESIIELIAPDWEVIVNVKQNDTKYTN